MPDQDMPREQGDNPPADHTPIDVQQFMDRPAGPDEPPGRVLFHIGRAVEDMIEEHERRFHAPPPRDEPPVRAIHSVAQFVGEIAEEAASAATRQHVQEHHSAALVTLEDLLAELEAQP